MSPVICATEEPQPVTEGWRAAAAFQVSPETRAVSALSTSLIVFACVFGGAIAGFGLRRVLPESHRNADSKDIIRTGTGLIATMSALVLGLLVASAKSSYDTQKDEVTAQAAKIALLDRVLAHYGSETGEIQGLLRAVVEEQIERTWGRDQPKGALPPGSSSKGEQLYDRIQDLSPASESQRGMKAQAIQLIIELAQTGSPTQAQKSSAISGPLLEVVVFWLTINFVSFGLFAPRNATVTTTLFLCALSVAGAVFLILEMAQPFGGVIGISDAPLRALLVNMGR